MTYTNQNFQDNYVKWNKPYKQYKYTMCFHVNKILEYEKELLLTESR